MRPFTGAKTEVSKTVAEATTSARCSYRSSTAKGTSRRTWKHRKAVPWDLQASHVSSGPRVSTHLNHCIELQLQRTRPHLYPRYVGINSYKTLGCRRYGKRQRATKNRNRPLLLNRKNLADSLQLLYVHASGLVPHRPLSGALLWTRRMLQWHW